jgi:hypothetical protein
MSAFDEFDVCRNVLESLLTGVCAVDMMALFIVLWLLNSSKQVQEAVGGYFKDPTGTAKKVRFQHAGRRREFRSHPRQHA